ncbi:DNA invertase Pin-like site-specific DNA recombinase [Kaistia hirudinis]|uniref:DNA invertase Pin-like site-specific DNA recombinase n=1 Tax=Kaistia hirudinis TaxID=1293440 RepID=A0A840AX19_9HYPH|nr:recombinase family protein [Kaistia hirudinis]MBB3933688.1 DNA invertase Pin-like site-specific DNA recombinase [Kaistia hirudinis]
MIVPRNEISSGFPEVRAAQYVRMSTEHQRYSTENQADAIRDYAARYNCTIVRTYADEGKSGLNIDGRAGLQKLIADVTGGHADFEIVLVYDISRWGRFQDADESAYYEYLCRRAGVRVEYCAEPFDNDGSLGSDIQKMLKRKMAGEYSRELSVKVFAGQCRLIEKGFRQGGPAGFGLRRQLVDEAGRSKALLARLEHKSIQTDRVVLIPGPSDEIEVVRRIYQSFVEDGRHEGEIAAMLNAEGIRTDLGRDWSRGTVHQVLINEKYIGNNVWNRGTAALKRKRTRNEPSMWIRAEGAFPAIVDHLLFDAAQAIIRGRSARLSDTDMLDVLRRLLAEHGYLSGLMIDEASGCPSSSAYRSRFGSLLRTYSLVGYAPDRDFAYVESNRRLRQRNPQVVDEVLAALRAAGASVTLDPETGILTINGEVTAALLLCRCTQTAAGSLRWLIRLDGSEPPDITIAVRMEPGEEAVRDYYLLPALDGRASRLRLAERNEASLDTFRFVTLDALYELMRRVPLAEVA